MSISRLTPPLHKAVEAIKNGQMVILVDDENRENEGDLIMAAEHVTAEAINFMVTHGRGLVCLPLEAQQIERLGLPMMTTENLSPYKTAFTVSIEAKHGVTTGISAADRAQTIKVACSAQATAQDIVVPGHIFPLKAASGGVLERPGHTEGSIELAKMAGLSPAAVICEILSADGNMARRAELEDFAQAHNIPLLTISELVNYRMHTPVPVQLSAAAPDHTIQEVAHAKLPSQYGGHDLSIHAFRTEDGVEHVALVKGNVGEGNASEAPLIRLHSECVTGDALGSLRCDCGPQLQEALRLIAQAPCGMLVYLRGHEGRGIGLANKVKAYSLQDQGYDTVEANHMLGFPTDARDWRAATAILHKLGIHTLQLMTNNPDKVTALTQQGFQVAKRVPLEIPPNPFNKKYLQTKRTRMGHQLADLVETFTS
ncbi:3,4-dihydroxy-2-butanone-4-phosphate synthase [Entomobacter blattae]|uniref:Multifunctional fusion protein n=1 Tax=Entomobacter blattae TaxID=2762277 RepID=A0A7H1NP38_9PROT|nr:3,4-dihydroxy-2-butanone-4-phosphate synthase [Entomobacter blattae]QNT77548.1 Riboflavin biosynthesis protein RibBA [Entomobacter blattae]